MCTFQDCNWVKSGFGSWELTGDCGASKKLATVEAELHLCIATPVGAASLNLAVSRTMCGLYAGLLPPCLVINVAVMAGWLRY
jgi:hypothetical protein